MAKAKNQRQRETEREKEKERERERERWQAGSFPETNLRLLLFQEEQPVSGAWASQLMSQKPFSYLSSQAHCIYKLTQSCKNLATSSRPLKIYTRTINSKKPHCLLTGLRKHLFKKFSKGIMSLTVHRKLRKCQ